MRKGTGTTAELPAKSTHGTKKHAQSPQKRQIKAGQIGKEKAVRVRVIDGEKRGMSCKRTTTMCAKKQQRNKDGVQKEGEWRSPTGSPEKAFKPKKSSTSPNWSGPLKSICQGAGRR